MCDNTVQITNDSNNLEKNSEENCKKRKLGESENGEIIENSHISSENSLDQTKNQDKEPKQETFNGVEISKLTKRQTKKYKKYLQWLDIKRVKRAKERQKLKEKKIQAKLNNVDLGPSRKKLKEAKMELSSCKIGVCIDLSFDGHMTDKDMAKTIKQILRVYTENRRAKAPMQLHLTNFDGKSKEEMSRHHGYENWDFNFHSTDYLEVFPKEKLVYLSSESENVIHTLEDDKIYIIGGLVDHNFHKGVCLKKAEDQGISHGRLPIAEYFWMKGRKVLTINQVFEILLRVSEGKSFKEAFELILPQRKTIVEKKTDAETVDDTLQSNMLENSGEKASKSDEISVENKNIECISKTNEKLSDNKICQNNHVAVESENN